jgi:hypothetical protein
MSVFSSYLERRQHPTIFRRAPVAELAVSCDENPPTPVAIVTRLCVMLTIALGFGLIAQVLVGATH